MSPARFLCATPVKTRLQSWSTGGTFRSYDLGVMSPARFLCATPVFLLCLKHTCDSLTLFCLQHSCVCRCVMYSSPAHVTHCLAATAAASASTPMLPCSHAPTATTPSNHSQDCDRSGSKKKTEKQQENLGEREVMLGHSQRRGM